MPGPTNLPRYVFEADSAAKSLAGFAVEILAGRSAVQEVD